LSCLVLVAETEEDFPDDVEQLRTDFRLIGKLDADAPAAILQQLLRSQLLGSFKVARGGQVGAEDVDHEVFDRPGFCLLGLGRLGLPVRDLSLVIGLARFLLRRGAKVLRLSLLRLGVALLRPGFGALVLCDQGLLSRQESLLLRPGFLLDGNTRLPDDAGNAGDGGNHYRSACGNTEGVASDEFAGPVRDRIGADADRFACQIALQVVRQREYRWIALAGLLAQRLGQYVLNIAAQQPLQSLRSRRTQLGTLRKFRRRHMAAQAGRERPSLDFDYGASDACHAR